jgi:type III restriction enzyme
LKDAQTIRNLSEAYPKAVLYKVFKEAINELTVKDSGTAEIKNYISLKTVKPKVTDEQPFLIPKKSIFNKVIGDNSFELEFASFCESRFSDVVAFAKNTMGDGGVNFKIEYQAQDGNIREFFPDFFVKTSDTQVFIVETKGREDLNDLKKIQRLVTWCKDVNEQQSERSYTPIYIKQEDWEKHLSSLKSFKDIVAIFPA